MKKRSEDPNKATEYEFHAEGMTVTVMAGMPSLHFENRRAVKKPSRPFHTHSWFEFFLVKKGGLVFSFEDGEITINEGEALFVAPDFSHYTVPVNEKTERLVFNFFIEKTESTSLSEELLAFLSFGGYIRLPYDPEISENADALAAAILSKNQLAAGCRLLLTIQRAAESKSSASPLSPLASDNDIMRLYQLEQIFNNLFREHLTMRGIAESLSISEKQLSRLIYKKYGCSFYRRLTDIRMKNAVALLLDGKSVSETAADVGYDSVPGFIGAFRKKFGCTPACWRKNNR